VTPARPAPAFNETVNAATAANLGLLRPNVISHAGPKQTVSCIGTPRPEILNKEITIALGKNRKDQQFKNVTGSVDKLLKGLLSKHVPGDKDGTCILQGELSGGERKGKNVLRNYLVLLDIDNGMMLDQLIQILKDSGLFAVYWTTHSHMRDVTDINEDVWLMWLREQPDARNRSEVENAEIYLRTEKKYTEAVCSTITSVTSAHLDGGVKVLVKHAPMHRIRVMFVLDEAFPFSGPDMPQVEQIKKWGEIYTNFADSLGIVWDKSCRDPSRLMFLPRYARDANPDDHEIGIVWGDLLTIERMQQKVAGSVSVEDQLANFTDAIPGAGKFKTPNLAKFMAQHARTFQAADWLLHVDPDGDRGPRPNGPGRHHRCPNEAMHSTQGPDDKGFFVVNAADLDSGFRMLCMHASCKSMFNDDRAQFLDKACQNAGIKDAMELRAWCYGDAAEEAAQEARAAAIKAKGVIDDRIGTLTPETCIEAVSDLLAALISEPHTMQTDARIDRIADATGRGKQTVRREYRRLRTIQENNTPREAPPAIGIEREPPEGDDYRGPISTSWHETVQRRLTRIILIEKNAAEPFLFVSEEGAVMQAVKRPLETVSSTDRPLGIKLVPVLTNADWDAVITKMGIVYTRLSNEGDRVEIAPPAQILQHLSGSTDLDLPLIKTIIRSPVMGPSGTIRHKPGYDYDTQMLLDPQMDYPPTPEVIEEVHVDDALWWLTEALYDFPFSDSFDGSDTLPIYTGEVDEEDYRLPNWERGKCSRVHAISMILQPFVRACIQGPCPAYHIDKSAPGTGAGYLVDTISIICEGVPATARTMSDSDEELRKNITAILREGVPIIFVDNINRKVDSGHIAAALTTGKWSDRLLGSTAIGTFPIRAMWIMAGNNLSFSHELMRRNIPVRMDASTPNPAKDRTGAKDFKHFPLQPWLIEHRAQLVWAVHVLLRNWVQKGMKWGSKRLNSFDSWAGVMSGIFEAAGVKGFLDNVPAYLDDNDEDHNSDETIGKILFEKFGEQPMRVGDIRDVLDNPMSEVTLDELGVSGLTPASKLASLGRYLSKQCKGRTFSPEGDTKFKLAKRILSGTTYYQLVRVN
jgi:hypothetical protein